jgi:hypothetical protein
MTRFAKVTIVSVIVALNFAGAAKAQYGVVNFPTLTFADEFDGKSKSSAKTKACTAFCKKSVRK